MIYINRNLEPVPNILLTDGLIETQNLCANFDADNTYFENKKSTDIFNSNVYAHKDVKDTLIRIQNHKCCFCESRMTHVSDGDVEHFRPKAEWLKEDNFGNKTKLKPGYYYLAYSWDNLLLSCQMCNQRIKGSNFPLINENIRVTISHHYNCTVELPIFINPSLEDPESHITFYDETPRGITYRGKKTIEYLQLDRNNLNEVRKEKLKDLFMYKEILNTISNIDIHESIIEMIKKRVNEIIEKNEQYVCMVKANFNEFL